MSGRFAAACAVGSILAAIAAQADAHATIRCSQYAKAIAAMQGEVDGLRRAARALARNARPASAAASGPRTGEATLLRQRADVEQSRLDGIRRNARHCSEHDRDRGHDAD